jgi:ABC-type lipoprotein export system ATPase subunit/bifunctional DNA-binding transcriptional regulator/antitoxin component of YhaV-PrlF toxin-antitoxin module
MTEPIIVCENLVKIFQVAELEVVALQGLDLTVPRGELLGIVGSSGSGKSTLMNVLGGLVRPSAGKVIVNGHDLLKLSDAAQSKYRREEVGFVWQQAARNLIPYLSAIENVTLPMTLAGRERQARQRAGELLDLVGLAERRDHRLPQLSGGEQQRVAIAVALANRPSLLLADEPTGELDSTTALSIYEALRALNRELGVTILIVSHDRTIVRHVGRVMAIRDGKTAGETVRRARSATEQPAESHAAQAAAEVAAHHDEHYEELLVLDSAGRLQIPKAYREALGIGDRVRMELGDDGTLVIHPAGGAAVAAVAPNEIVAEDKEAHAKALRGEGAKEEKENSSLPLRLGPLAPWRERLRRRGK